MTILSDLPVPLGNFLQMYSVVISLTLLTVLVAEGATRLDVSPVGLYVKLIFIDIIVLMLLGVFLLPASGRFAIALQWNGIICTILMLAVLAVGFVRRQKQFPGTKQKRPWFRYVVATLIVACLLFFVVGFIGVRSSWLTSDQYVLIVGVAGSVASVVGLLSLARPSLKREDLAALELESLKHIAETSEEIKRLDLARAAAEQQIGSLETQKRQMEFLVQKASLSLFLQEQRKLYEKRIKDEVSTNRVLLANLDELTSIEQKLKALEEEISKDPNVDLLQRIIKAARREPDESNFSDYPPLTRSLFLLMREAVRAVTKIVGRL